LLQRSTHPFKLLLIEPFHVAQCNFERLGGRVDDRSIEAKQVRLRCICVIPSLMLPLEVEIRGSKCSEAVDVRLSSAEVMNHAIRYIRTKGQATVAVVAQLLLHRGCDRRRMTG
jgi:hypothetical protein